MKGSTSFLKKRSKKLLDPDARLATSARANLRKFFGSRRAGAAFFQKRTASLKGVSP
jgi:hypothetical protein